MRQHRKWIGLLSVLLCAAGAAALHYTSTKQKLKRFASKENIPKETANDFYEDYSVMAKSLLKNNKSSLVPALTLYGNNSTLFDYLHKAAMNDPQITRITETKTSGDTTYDVILKTEEEARFDIAAKTSNLALETDSASNSLNKEGIYTLGNLTIAYNHELPEHSSESVKAMLETVKDSPILVDFEPIVVKDASARAQLYFK